MAWYKQFHKCVTNTAYISGRRVENVTFIVRPWTLVSGLILAVLYITCFIHTSVVAWNGF